MEHITLDISNSQQSR